jgi:hypothetical protein
VWVVGCGTISDVALEGVDFAGAKASVFCDRRFVTAEGQPAAFCQELVGTVAAAEFSDDCRTKHHARPGPGLCPRSKILAGCQILEKHDDDSVATDWYYDVSDFGDAGDAGDAGIPRSADAGITFESRPSNLSEVRTFCADPARYEHGAAFSAAP